MVLYNYLHRRFTTWNSRAIPPGTELIQGTECSERFQKAKATFIQQAGR